MAQLSLEPIVNKNLFSNHYLENLIQRNIEWELDDHEEVFEKIKRIYQREMAFLEGLNESQLEERFFKQIFKIILPDFEVQATTKAADFPDYAFFSNRKTQDDAHNEKGKKSFYTNAFAIGEVKRWSVELDRFGKDKHNKRRNPSFQIWLYLHETDPKWGILSNGRKWRLYHRNKPLDCYYEIDLVTLLENNDLEGFRYFYYFFRKEAFLPSEEGQIFLNHVLKESADYAKEIGDNLKENVYRAMKIIADGFLHWPQNGLTLASENTRKEVQISTMRLLYRFLFLLYAEGKGLINLEDEQYRKNHSFYRIKKEIAERTDGPTQHYYSPASTSLWSSLKDLFRLIDRGSEAFGIPKTKFYVPAYNGGLFEAKKNPNLERWNMGDTYLAYAIDLLARSKTNGREMAFVDYSTLEIRHLGSIYEGLLEYKLKIAETDMVVKGGGKKKEWVTLEEFNKSRSTTKSFGDFDEFDKVQAGNIYLATENEERKATGSYYTPDYIVNYIVENTIGPVIEKKWENAKKEGNSLVDVTLLINVLDPAMGSGHFLVGAIEFMAGKLLEAAQQDIENELIADDGHYTADWAKREVVSHCIYGVDLNYLAVELAKVSLWLTTISKDKPLSFLDHRLKQGNSLIGAKIIDLAWLPKLRPDQVGGHYDKPFGLVGKILEKLRELEAIPEDTLDEIRKKEVLFNQLKESDEYRRLKSLADVHTGLYFADIDFETIRSLYMDLVNEVYYGNPVQWEDKFRKSWVLSTMKHEEGKKFFHWELEFPEIFFEKGGLKGNFGFDVVIGNPPYVRAETADKEQRKFLMDCNYYETTYGRFDVYAPFIERGLKLLKNRGYWSMIIPSAMMVINYTEKLRSWILSSKRIESIWDLSQEKVFREASVTTCIPVINNNQPPEGHKIHVQIGLPDISEVKFQTRQKIFLLLPGYSIRPELQENDLILKEKMDNISIKMGEICYCITGCVAHDSRTGASKDRLIHSEPINETCKPYLEAKEWYGRYSKLKPIRYIEYKPELMHRPKFPELFESSKILIQRLASGNLIQATLDREKIYVNHVLNCCVKLEDVYHLGSKRLHIDLSKITLKKRYNISYILAIVCSLPLGVYHNRFLSPGLDIFPETMRNLPIRYINFTTQEPERELLLKEAKHLYTGYLENKDILPLIDFIETQLPKDKKGKFIGKNEKSDVVHDLLAYLAEQMIDMNCAKNQEVQGFLDWLETELRVSIDSLSNRTRLKEYYKHDFDRLLTILKKNKKNINVNISSREFQNNLRNEFEKSINMLSPLRERIKITDRLINNIVYKLYGLVEEEIKVIEESNKLKDLSSK